MENTPENIYYLGEGGLERLIEAIKGTRINSSPAVIQTMQQFLDGTSGSFESGTYNKIVDSITNGDSIVFIVNLGGLFIQKYIPLQWHYTKSGTVDLLLAQSTTDGVVFKNINIKSDDTFNVSAQKLANSSEE